MRGFYMDEAFTGSPSDLEHISHDTNFTAKQWVDNTSTSLAPIESTSTASQPYTVGKRLVYGGRLYKVTQAIAQGGTLTPGTNITEDDVSSELDAINANLTAMKPSVIRTTQTHLTVNKAMIIDGETSNVISGSRPTGQSYIPVVVNQSDTLNHNTNIFHNASNSSWYLITDVKQEYVINFYKMPS